MKCLLGGRGKETALGCSIIIYSNVYIKQLHAACLLVNMQATAYNNIIIIAARLATAQLFFSLFHSRQCCTVSAFILQHNKSLRVVSDDWVGVCSSSWCVAAINFAISVSPAGPDGYIDRIKVHVVDYADIKLASNTMLAWLKGVVRLVNHYVINFLF